MRHCFSSFPAVYAIFLVIVSGSSISQAQDQAKSGPSAPRSSPLFDAESTLVLIPATVTDSSNRYLLGLKKKDFQILDNGIEQTITDFSGEDAPLSIGLVFDTSGSMGDKLRMSRQAAFDVLKTMNPQDEAFLVEFKNQAELAAGFTGDLKELQQKLSDVQPGGLTSLLDAVELALHEMKKAKNPRKAILIISDGGDNNSHYTARDIESLVREADVQIYAMGVFEPSFYLGMPKEEISGPRLLSEVAEQSGGRLFAASDIYDLPSVAARIGIELRNQYVLAYSPKDQPKDGKYHSVEVKVTEPAGIPHVKVRWRHGYYAPSR
ncbi:MAG TPA: VWA domain-containing protein [Bryobacteraceae bacterium]|nr:VWA domain-containing protein [Bryobacteraceae bacterium]